MTKERINDSATSNVLAWSSQGAHMQHEPEDEVAAEVDEPPDDRTICFIQNQFKRTTVRKCADNSQSLLTKALHSQSDDGEAAPFHFSRSPSCRRSMNSIISLASTAELTSDTGVTSPARTNTPSPPPPVIQFGRLNAGLFNSKARLEVNNALGIMGIDMTPTKKRVDVPHVVAQTKDPAVEVLAKKRCISFACGPKPDTKKTVSPQVPAQSAETTLVPATNDEKPQRRTCIKFACTAKPSSRNTPPQEDPACLAIPEARELSSKNKGVSPSTARKYRSSSTGRSHRSLTPRRSSQSPFAVRSKKFLAPNPTDLNRESTRFHEFASDELQEEDWIRQDPPISGRRLTINDTLQKENEIRRLGKEAEEEALEEEDEEDALEDDDDEDIDNPDNPDEDEDDLEADEADDEDDVEDRFSGYGSEDDISDGYHTDNEIGFADSDDDGEGGELDLWTHGQAEPLQPSGATPIARRRPSLSGNRSDSSTSEELTRGSTVREKIRRIKIRPGTPELPDSTDFVCGTLDEDRPLEDAYISCIAQKRREKLHIIPQDIDPSFPTSDFEVEGEGGSPKPAHGSDDHVWIHGEIEDLHHEQNRPDRRKKRGDLPSPKRYQSPPPKRHLSPAPKARGRSPQRIFDRCSPRRLVLPPPPGRVVKSPPASPLQNAEKGRVDFKTLASTPGLTHTKSLPRAPVMFPNHFKGQRRRQAAKMGTEGHVRGAIDIVKGLEHKRERRKEKFLQKHCTRARKGQLPEKKQKPGLGAERMRELGLLMAGKIPAGNYVLSV